MSLFFALVFLCLKSLVLSFLVLFFPRLGVLCFSLFVLCFGALVFLCFGVLVFWCFGVLVLCAVSLLDLSSTT